MRDQTMKRRTPFARTFARSAMLVLARGGRPSGFARISGEHLMRNFLGNRRDNKSLPGAGEILLATV